MKREQVLDVMAQSIRELITHADQSWRKEWGADGYRQQNVKATEYRNENQIILFNQAVKNDYKDPRWMTFNQINENGFKLEKGSKASPIMFYSRTDKKLDKDDNGRPKLDKEGNKVYTEHLRDKPVFVSYNVFNATKIEGIEPFVLKQVDNTASLADENNPSVIILKTALELQKEDQINKTALDIYNLSPELFVNNEISHALYFEGDNPSKFSYFLSDETGNMTVGRAYADQMDVDREQEILVTDDAGLAQRLVELLNSADSYALSKATDELHSKLAAQETPDVSNEVKTILDTFPDLEAKFIRYGLSDGSKFDFGLSEGDHGVTPRYLSLGVTGHENDYVLVKDVSDIPSDKVGVAINALRNLDENGLNQLVRAYDDKYLNENREAVNSAGEQFRAIMDSAKDIGTAARINPDHAPDNFNGFSLVTQADTGRDSIRFSEPNGNSDTHLLTGLNAFWTQDIFNKINEIDRTDLAHYFFEQNNIQKESPNVDKALSPSQLLDIQKERLSTDKALSPSQLLAIRNEQEALPQAFTVYTGGEGQHEVRKNTGDLISIFATQATADFVALQLNDFVNKSPDEKQAAVSQLQEEIRGQNKYATIERDVKDYCERTGIELREIASEGAFYRNGQIDKFVVMPLKEQFGGNQDAYYATLMHELVHSTKAVEGTRKILETDGPQGNNFGSQNYAREELVAEVGSLLLCNHYGLNSYADPQNEKLSELTQNSAAYLKGWFEGGKLEDADIVNAVSEAKRASNLITGDNLKIAAKISQAERPEIAEKTAMKI
ncbi:TPA: DUF1738 domain-containing protein [Yersinia enterocolitica]|nr:DUF1738 domain-containing protein [Yersinia enterocolitica]